MIAAAACRWCGEDHGKTPCPMVKALEFDVFGNVTRVEFVTMADVQHQQQRPEDPPREYPKLGQVGGTGGDK